VGAINASPQLERAELVGTYFPEDSRVYLVPARKLDFLKILSNFQKNRRPVSE
jgi:iron complex outermembrane receptor protein